MKKILLKLWSWIMRSAKGIDAKVDKLLPVVSNIVQIVKKAIGSKDFDMWALAVKKLIPGEVDDLIIDNGVALAREHIPKLALRLKIVTTIADAEDPHEQLIEIFNRLQTVSDETWNQFCSQLAQQLLIDMVDGDVSWGEAGVYVELYYKTYIKK